MRSRRSGAHRPALDETADAQLVERTRAGDVDAYGELWRRHYPSGIAVARSVTSSIDADDLVQEAYTRIYRSIRGGSGPTGAFRPYLFTSIRNTAAAWGRARRETATDEWDAVPDPDSGEQAVDDALDRGLTHRAFRSLPTRWQEVLWYSEIEQMKPAAIAPLLGMKANAVAQLAVRAREGLRAAWIQAHLQSVADGSDCQWTIERLGAYARGTLGKRDRGKIDTHLHDCARCAIVAAEAKDVSDRLALVLLPLVLGAGATGYAAWVQLGAPVAAVAGMPSAVVLGAVVVGAGTGGASGSTSSAGGAGTPSGGLFAGASAMAGLVTAGVLVVGTLAVAAVVVPRALSASTSDPAAGASTALTLPDTSNANVVGEEPVPENLPSAPEEKRPEQPAPPAPPAPPVSPTPTPQPPVADGPEAPPTPVAQHPVVVTPAAPVEDDADAATAEPADPAPSESAEPQPGPSPSTDPTPTPTRPADPDPAPDPTPGDGTGITDPGETPPDVDPDDTAIEGTPTLVSAKLNGVAHRKPVIALTLSGTPGATVRVLVDGSVAAEARVGEDGVLTLDVTVPWRSLWHTTIAAQYVDGDVVGQTTASSLLSLLAGHGLSRG